MIIPEDEDVEMLVNLVNTVHDTRMQKEDDGKPMNIEKEDFDELIKKQEKKNKRSYDFLVKTGEPS